MHLQITVKDEGATVPALNTATVYTGPVLTAASVAPVDDFVAVVAHLEQLKGVHCVYVSVCVH